MIEQLGFDMDWGEFYYWRVGGGGGGGGGEGNLFIFWGLALSSKWVDLVLPTIWEVLKKFGADMAHQTHKVAPS